MKKSRQRKAVERSPKSNADPAPPSPPKYKRAGFFLRITTHIIDIAIALTALSYLVNAPGGVAMVLTIWTYFFACDMLFGRTLGKMFIGLIYLTKNEEPVIKSDLAGRAFLRFLLIFGVLSLKKTTLIDLLTGIRVYTRVPPPKSKGPPQSRRQLELNR